MRVEGRQVAPCRRGEPLSGQWSRDVRVGDRLLLTAAVVALVAASCAIFVHVIH